MALGGAPILTPSLREELKDTEIPRYQVPAAHPKPFAQGFGSPVGLAAALMNDFQESEN